MPYNDDGFYYEEARHGKDADRRFASEEEYMEQTVRRIDSLLLRPRIGSRRQWLTNWRNNLLVSLHDHRLAGAIYDARFREAMSDPTGQDLDAFYGDY